MKHWINRAFDFLEKSLVPLPQELNEIDWKIALSENNEKLSRHLSAFANHPGGGFMVYGIDDKTAEIVGVERNQVNTIVEKLSNLTRDTLDPKVKMDHSVEQYQNKELLFVHIKESAVKPVQIAGKTMEDVYIRNGGTTRKASKPEIGSLMLNSKLPVFEELHASNLKTKVQVLSMLDYTAILKMLNKPVPTDIEELFQWMHAEKMIDPFESDGYYITNFGALAAGIDLKQFDGLTRKSVRLIKYQGKDKTGESREFPGNKGYAIGFEGLILFIKGLLPGSEVVKNALRVETSVYPEVAIRELIANALIHQDFTIRGSGPMIEIFEDRIEITNPGKLLPDKKIDRLIRTTPESRNELLASAFRRFNICEERGSGFEKVVTAIELFGLPPLKLEEQEHSFKATLYAPRKFADMSENERIEACYQHSIIQYFAHGGMSNASLRERFKMNDKQTSQISRLINIAIEKGKVKIKNPESSSRKYALYIPYWA
jgi:ATP-dependent DNA helicase RecG